MLLRFAYITFLGILLALFVGVGIATFYPEPKIPETINTPRLTPPETASEEAQLQLEAKRNQAMWQQYEENRRVYSRNISISALVISVILLVTGLLLFKKMEIISDGVVLGSLLTLIYSIFRGFASRDETFRFISVSVGLLIALYLGYEQFVKVKKRKK